MHSVNCNHVYIFILAFEVKINIQKGEIKAIKVFPQNDISNSGYYLIGNSMYCTEATV